ncbi:MAG: hypothetical protein JWR13_5469, partial [Mycobacterium sp.]|nr:hypothetical protein [Mycobacterium sp.]
RCVLAGEALTLEEAPLLQDRHHHVIEEDPRVEDTPTATITALRRKSGTV